MGSDANNKGVFVISLDFELIWGVWDVTTIQKYGEHVKGVKKVIPRLIDLFEQYGFKATFATVGMLFARNKEELLASVPETKPGYDNPDYNVYLKEFDAIGQNEIDDPYHFGYSLLEQLLKSKHEIATHTFSHYFCLEGGQTAESFDADIKAAINISGRHQVAFDSFVFPRNQVNINYLNVLTNNGIRVYRGNPVSWIYKPRKFSAEVIFIRICRLLDTYFPVSGYNTYRINKQDGLPVNIPASRFLKPYNKNIAWLEKLKLKRIMIEMTRAAKQNEMYHLWWHPHNFGINIEENLANLTVLLDHYRYLNKKYGFTNCTMKEAAGF